MGQRLGIAGALLGDPRVVMLDEPVNGLDPEGILWIRTLLQDLAREGRTVFVSSHLMSEMELMAEHYVIIGRGRLIEDISAEGLKAMAAGKTTHVSADRLDDLVSLLRADGVTVDSTERGTVGVSGLSPEEIGVIARDHGIALTRLVPGQRSLEDVFMELTAHAVEYHGHGAPPPDAPLAA
jgi:ABC-2 type transport system ATP-binding protein